MDDKKVSNQNILKAANKCINVSDHEYTNVHLITLQYSVFTMNCNIYVHVYIYIYIQGVCERVVILIFNFGNKKIF